MNTKIKHVHARQIVDCKCRPCVEVDVVTEDGALGVGAAPTGLSVGMYEASLLRDGNEEEYQGLGVRKAVDNVNNIIAPSLAGLDVLDQQKIDETMITLDGTPMKENLGGNAIYSTSIACFRAMAAAKNKPLYECIAGGKIDRIPVPSFNVINGGDFEKYSQFVNEFIILPYGAESIDKAVEMGIAVYQKLEEVITDYLGTAPGIAPSYGYISPSDDPFVVMELLSRAISLCGYEDRFAFGIDCAASERYNKENDTYLFMGQEVGRQEIINMAKELSEKYNFLFMEDVLDENDWEGWTELHKAVDKTNIIGDDLTVTNRQRLEKAYTLDAVDGFVLKPNQVGTISEAFDTYEFAKEKNLLAIASGRSGGVLGDVVMDLAVGLQVGFIKNGAPKSGERIDKLNFLLRAADLNSPCPLADISGFFKR